MPKPSRVLESKSSMRRTLMKIGALTFALTVLGGFMANAAVSGCSSSRQASPEPENPAVKARSTEAPSKESPTPAASEPEEYLPATKVGTFHRSRQGK